MAQIDRPLSYKIAKWLPWVAGLVFVAGGIAFLIAYYGNTADTHPIAATGTGPVQDLSGTPKTVPVDPKARRAAGEFITSAVTRQNLRKGWQLAEPGGYVRPAGMTLKEWMTGNIPVQYYPAKAIDAASFRVETSFKNELTLNVYIFAKQGSGVKSQPFFIVMRPHGKGAHKRWLVNNFVPSSGAVTVPNEGGTP
jgi:hypothetical protein